MLEANRLTKERVLAAYSALPQITAAQDVYTLIDDGVQCACGISAVLMAEKGKSFEEVAELTTFDATTNASTADKLAAEIGLSADYIDGFVWGFDQSYEASNYYEWIDGYEDGLAAAQAIFGPKKADEAD